MTAFEWLPCHLPEPAYCSVGEHFFTGPGWRCWQGIVAVKTVCAEHAEEEE